MLTIFVVNYSKDRHLKGIRSMPMVDEYFGCLLSFFKT